ncbi:MAG: hypothetical protein Q9174_002520 [Haloplaca sp. 1 TL-2023]
MRKTLKKRGLVRLVSQRKSRLSKMLCRSGNESNKSHLSRSSSGLGRHSGYNLLACAIVNTPEPNHKTHDFFSKTSTPVIEPFFNFLSRMRALPPPSNRMAFSGSQAQAEAKQHRHKANTEKATDDKPKDKKKKNKTAPTKVRISSEEKIHADVHRYTGDPIAVKVMNIGEKQEQHFN